MNSLIQILSRGRTPASPPVTLPQGMDTAPLPPPMLMELGPTNIERVAEILAERFLGAERGLPAAHLLTHVVRGLTGMCRRAIRHALSRMRGRNKPMSL